MAHLVDLDTFCRAVVEEGGSDTMQEVSASALFITDALSSGNEDKQRTLRCGMGGLMVTINRLMYLV